MDIQQQIQELREQLDKLEQQTKECCHDYCKCPCCRRPYPDYSYPPYNQPSTYPYQTEATWNC